MNKQTRCRFAPSPTGYLHVGGARTALFNYLFAKANGGTFILRIEDTDLQRSTPEAVDAIFNGLKWLGIEPDKGPFFQTKRMNLYQDYARQLLTSGHAYQCTCTSEQLQKIREEQQARKETPKYPNSHRPSECTPQPTELPTGSDTKPFVIRLRTPQEGYAVHNDLILGKIQTPFEQIDDFIIMRSDGTPTYNFVVVVDDVEMQMTHIIRGSDHVSNTPKQIAVYQALNAEIPIFAHVPMILGPDKKKLSKRHGATSVIEYKKDGYLPQAFVNYLARLGWSHGDQELFSKDELEKLFNLKAVGKSPAVFDTTKLQWVNAEHIKQTPPSKLAPLVCEFLTESGIECGNAATNDCFLLLIKSLVERVKTLNEMAEKTQWFFKTANTLTYDPKASKKHLKPECVKPLTALIAKIETLEELSENVLEAEFTTLTTQFNIKLGKIAQPVRVALTGTSVSPPIYTVIEVLGKKETLARLHRGIQIAEEQ